MQSTPQASSLIIYSFQIQHFAEELAEFTFAYFCYLLLLCLALHRQHLLLRIFLFSHGLRGLCLGKWIGKCQETVTNVRNVLYLYNILKSVLLKHVEAMSQLHADGLHFQRWEASTTSLKV